MNILVFFPTEKRGVGLLFLSEKTREKRGHHDNGGSNDGSKKKKRKGNVNERRFEDGVTTGETRLGAQYGTNSRYSFGYMRVPYQITIS